MFVVGGTSSGWDERTVAAVDVAVVDVAVVDVVVVAVVVAAAFAVDRISFAG